MTNMMSRRRGPQAGGRGLPGGVAPADRCSGADVLPVEEKPSRHRTSDQRQDAEVPFGGQSSGEAARHVGVVSQRWVVAVTRGGWDRWPGQSGGETSDGMTEETADNLSDVKMEGETQDGTGNTAPASE